MDSFYVPRLYACLVRHYPTWDGPDSTRARAQAAAAAGKLPESWEVASDVNGTDAVGDKNNRLRTLPGAVGGRMGFMAFNVSEPTMDRCAHDYDDAVIAPSIVSCVRPRHMACTRVSMRQRQIACTLVSIPILSMRIVRGQVLTGKSPHCIMLRACLRRLSLNTGTA